MTTTTEEKVEKNEKPSESSTTSKEKVRAGEDVIKYAETNKEEKTAKKPAPQALKRDEKYVEGFDRTTGKVIRIPLAQVKALSRYIYVHNIFDQTPVIEHVRYKMICPGNSHVSVDIDETLFEDLRHLPQFRGHVHYNYVDGMLKNDPKKGGFYHRTFHASYPEWIRPEDVQSQAKALVSHYGIPDLSGIEKVLWPDFNGQVKRPSLGEEVKEEKTEEVQEDGEE